MEKTARDIMTTDLITTTPSATVVELAQLLARNKISGMPVVDAGEVVGVVSEADILTAAGQTTIEWVMTNEIFSVTPETPISEITKVLKAHGIKRVLVLDEAENLIGIVSRSDIVAARAFE